MGKERQLCWQGMALKCRERAAWAQLSGHGHDVWTGQMQHWVSLFSVLLLVSSCVSVSLVCSWMWAIYNVIRVVTVPKTPQLSRPLRVWHGNGWTYSKCGSYTLKAPLLLGVWFELEVLLKVLCRLEAHLWVDAKSKAEGGILTGDAPSALGFWIRCRSEGCVLTEDLAFLVLRLDHNKVWVLTGDFAYNSNIVFMIF